MIAASLKPLRDAGLQPVGVDLSAFGLIRALGDAGGRPAAARARRPRAGRAARPLLQRRRRHQPRRRARAAPASSPASPRSASRTSPAELCRLTGLTPEHARMWLGHVGLEQPLEQIEGDPDDGRQGPRGARERRLLPARRAAALARLLRRPGGRRCRSSASSSAGPAARSPASPRTWSRSSACRSRSAAPRRSPASTPASAARLTLSYGLALEQLAMRPVNLIPAEERRGGAPADAGRPARLHRRRRPGRRCCVGVAAAGRHRQPDLRQQGGSRPARRARTPRPKRAPQRARRLHPVPRASATSGSPPSPASPTAASTGSG